LSVDLSDEYGRLLIEARHVDRLESDESFAWLVSNLLERRDEWVRQMSEHALDHSPRDLDHLAGRINGLDFAAGKCLKNERARIVRRINEIKAEDPSVA
jgi:hypothetical protein